MDFIKNDCALNHELKNRVLVYAGLINTMTDVVGVVCMYYYKRFSSGSADYSVFISMHINVVKKKLECADLMTAHSDIPKVNDVIINLCKTCEGDLASCIMNYTVGNKNYSLLSETDLETKDLAERVQITGKKFMNFGL